MDTGTEPTRFLFHVGVHDPVERERLTRVGVRGYRIVVKTPPGEGFTLSKRDARQFAAFLWEAVNRADDDPDDPDDLVTPTFTAALAAATTTTATYNRWAGVAPLPRTPLPPASTTTPPADAP